MNEPYAQPLPRALASFASIAALIACVGTRVPVLRAAADHGCALTDFKTDGSIGGRYNAATQTLAYSRPAKDGHFHAYLSDPDGNNERVLTNEAWLPNRHQFVVEWHPSGQYLFVEVEKRKHLRSSTDAIPGYGAFTDLWLVTRDGTRAWKLIDLPNDYNHALTHMAITPDGSTITWTERVKSPKILQPALWAGAYVFGIAQLVLDSAPHLANIRTVDPGGADQGGEVDGISADGSTIAFYSTFKTKNLFATRIYTWNLARDSILELSHDSFSQAPRYTPGGSSLVYMSGSHADIFFGEVQGADWWIVGVDGSNRRRLTFMNKRGSPQSVGHYRLAGVLSFDSDSSFYGDVMTKPLGLVGKIVKVRCEESFR